MRVVGIDLGLNGAIAYIDDDGGYRTFNMPCYAVRRGRKTQRKIDKRGLFEILKGIKTDKIVCFIEKQRPFPKQGIVSAFHLGEQQGLVEGILLALGISYESIYPQQWQKEFSIIRSKNTKFASYEKASSLFPNAKLKTERGKILDGRCDALLIAEYGRRKVKIGSRRR